MRTKLLALRLQRQQLVTPVAAAGYDALYRDLQPGMNLYWHGFGQPPECTFRADFDDVDYNRQRQARRQLLRFGNWFEGILKRAYSAAGFHRYLVGRKVKSAVFSVSYGFSKLNSICHEKYFHRFRGTVSVSG